MDLKKEIQINVNIFPDYIRHLSNCECTTYGFLPLKKYFKCPIFKKKMSGQSCRYISLEISSVKGSKWVFPTSDWFKLNYLCLMKCGYFKNP